MEQEQLMQACAQRRQRVLEQLPENSVAIVFGSTDCYRNHDAHYPFRQNSDCYYLSGLTEADPVIVLSKKNNQSILFSQKKDPSLEQWIGPRVGVDAAKSFYQFDEAYELDALSEKMPELLENAEALYVCFDQFQEQQARVFAWLETVRKKVRKGINAPGQVADLSYILHELRLIKSDDEIEILREACEISATAHKRAMVQAKPNLYEYQVESELLHYFMQHGARFPAYESIVATGSNACVLHYTQNQDQLQDGDLLLIDAGCEKNYYAADITRTFPVSGTFSKPQKEIYELVLKAQEAAIELIKPGVLWTKMQEVIIEVLTAGLVDLGILQGEVDALIKEKSHLKYYMHGSGHWLGLDVHDRGHYQIDNESRPLQANMVFTVEPGLYLAKDDTSIPEAYRGIGVRIEDDILVTENGYEVLTAIVPKTITEVEAACHAEA